VISEEPRDDRELTVEQNCACLVERMAELRAFNVPPPDADPPAVHDKLRELRRILDEAETVKQEIGRLRYRARRTARRLAWEADDTFDTAMAGLVKTAVRREYEGVQDRMTQARVTASPKRREARAAERVADLVDEANDLIARYYFSLRDIRRELLVTLEHFLPWEASMER
jgi:hypothetical protein